MIRTIGPIGLACLLLFSPSAVAETTQCTAITALPTTISTQGVYCLTGDLTTGINTGDAITINVNNVTLDCNNRKIGGLSAGDGTRAHGIFANERQNITIRNCNIRGFYRGVVIDGLGGSGHSIEDNTFDGNTYLGMRVAGDGVRIRGNRIIDTGGTTDASGTFGGMILSGSGGHVSDNDVSGAFQGVATRSLVGIAINGSRNVVQGNRVSALLPAPGRVVMGVLLTGPEGDSGQRNVIGNSLMMLPGTQGFPIFNADTDVCRGNTATGFDADWLAMNQRAPCIDAGGNHGLGG